MRSCLIVAFLFIHFLAAAQQKKESFPVVTLRTNPLSFAEEDAGIVLGMGMQWSSRWAISIDPMFIFYSPYHLDQNNTGNSLSDGRGKTRGVKIRGEVRYYFRNYLYGKRGWFGAVELHYKKVNAAKWADFGMNGANGQYDFYQHAQYDEVKTEEGIAAKMGWLCRLWSPRWVAEFYTGIGLKLKQTTQKNQPAGGSFLSSPNESSVFSLDEGGPYPMFPIGIKLVYRIF